MKDPYAEGQPSFAEFITMMAMMVALVALSLDAMLPALPDIGADFGVQRENDRQLVVSTVFLGLALGQIVYGPLSDSIGRKPAIYIGMALYMFGCLLSVFADSFAIMLGGRVLQGLGLAAPRTVCIALVRDKYQGQAMARVVSFTMAIFVLVPALAPAIGQSILLFAGWRAIFGVFLAMSSIALLWFAIRQPETLPPEKRVALSLRGIATTVAKVCRHPVAIGYTFAAGMVFGAFVGYLSSAQQIFQVQYGLGKAFPLFFAGLALTVGAAGLINGRLVMSFGMQALTRWALRVMCALSVGFWLIAYALAGHPPLWALMIYQMAAFLCIGTLFGNLNALAMEPLGDVAGVGAAVVGSISTFLSVPLGIIIGAAFDGTVLPLVGGFAALSAVAAMISRWTESRSLPAEGL